MADRSEGAIEFKKSKNRKVLLLFHGMTGAPKELVYLARSIHPKGYDVICPVLPGHLVGLKEVMETTWQDWYKSSLEEYREVSKQYDEVFLGGICLGSNLATLIATEEKNIKGLLVLAPILYLDGWSLPWYRFLIWFCIATPLKYFCIFPEKGPMGIKDDVVRDKIKKSFVKKEGALDCFPITCVLELLRLSPKVRKKLKSIRAPTLLIHSKHDDLAGIRSSQEIYNNISSDKKEIIFLENSYHLIALDKEKEQVFAHCLKFLKENSTIENNDA